MKGVRASHPFFFLFLIFSIFLFKPAPLHAAPEDFTQISLGLTLGNPFDGIIFGQGTGGGQTGIFHILMAEHSDCPIDPDGFGIGDPISGAGCKNSFNPRAGSHRDFPWVLAGLALIILLRKRGISVLAKIKSTRSRSHSKH